MFCKLCNLYKETLNEVNYVGSKNPDIYFIIKNPDYEDLVNGNLGQSMKGRYFSSLLKNFEITNYRIASCIRCSSKNNNITEDHYKTCIRYNLLKDILITNPKLVVTLGKDVKELLLSDKNKLYQLSKFKIANKDFNVYPMESINILSDEADNENKINDYLNKLRLTKFIADDTYVDFSKIKLSYALNYKDFKDYYVKNLINKHCLAYDIETNAELVYSKEFEIVGFSLATKSKGIYVCLDALDYHMSDNDVKLCKQLLVNILKTTKHVIVHNMLYEMPATLYNLHYKISFDKIEDTMVAAKIMLGGHLGAGLKPNAQKIGYPEWDADLGTYVNAYTGKLLPRLKLVRNKPILEALRKDIPFKQFIKDYKDENKDNEKDLYKLDEIEGYFNEIYDVLAKYYNEEEITNLDKLISNKVITAFDYGIPGTIPYNWIPYRMLCKYGATDSVATYDLKDYFINEFKTKSTDEVNLFKGYHYDKMEHYVGYSMINAGMYWNDDLAIKDRASFEEACLYSLKYVVHHPVIKDYIFNNTASDYIMDEIYENYNDYIWDNFHIRLAFVDDGRYKYKLEYLNKNNQSRLKHAKHLFDNDFINKLPDRLRKAIKKNSLKRIFDDIDNSNNIDFIKEFFSPSSTGSKTMDVIRKIVNKGKDLNVDHFILTVKESMLDRENFNIDDIENENDKNIVLRIKNYLSLDKKNQEKCWNEYNWLKKIVLDFSFKDNELNKIQKESKRYKIEKADDGAQIDNYNHKLMEPIIEDDPNTWTDSFKWMFMFRVHKKTEKMITTYFDGTVGRKSLKAVDRKELQSGQETVYRLHDYNKPLKDNEEWLIQTSFSIGNARTGRWKSAQHTIPSNASIKNFYQSRYPGGTILQPDFSSNELRCIASAAHEDNMIKAFNDGLDIHRSNASLIFNVPYDEVIPAQRRFAKTLSFATIYGASEKSIAERYFHGDIDKAHELFEHFYGAFPKLKQWINDKRKEGYETGQVSVLTDRFLKIDMDKSDQYSVSRALRQCSNFPVQSAASTVAATVFCDIILHQEKQGYKTKPICFIHDSLESDVYPYELFDIIKYQQYELINGAKDYFGLILKADLSLGYSMGHECEVKDIEILDDKHTKGYITLSGYKDTIYDTLENWKLAYNKVEIVEEDFKEVYFGIFQLFLPRKAFDPNAMSTRYEGTLKVYIQYYNDNGEIDPIETDKHNLKFYEPWKESKLLNLIKNTYKEVK